MSNSVRRLVHFAFVYTCVEGLIVNLTYPNVVAYLIKDIAILIAYVFLMTEQRGTTGSLRKLTGPIVAFAALMVFFVILPTPVTLIAEFVALKQRLFYIPLMYVGYAYTRTEQDAYRLIKLLAWTAIPTALFGIFLFFQGPSALQMMGGTYSSVIYSTAGAAGISFWRVPGTFTSPGQYSLYLLMQSVLLTGFLFLPTVTRKEKLIPALALVASFGALLLSGTRAPLVVYVLCVGLGLLYMGRLTKLGTTALTLYAALTIAFTYFGGGVEDRVGSVLTQDNYDRFRNTAFGQSFYAGLGDQPLGLGLGTATMAGRHFTDWNKLVLVESYFGVIATETGYLGLALCLWLMGRTALVVAGSRTLVKNAPWSPLWVFIALVILAIIGLMPSSTIIDAAPGNMYFWFLLGMAMRFVDIERARKSAALPDPHAYPPGLAQQYAFHAPR
jgi:hypothetical protein